MQPGESQTLSFRVSAYELALFNEDASAWQTAAGDYQVRFGASATDIRASAAFAMKKSQEWPVNNIFGIKDIEHFPAVGAQPAGRGLRYAYSEGGFMSVEAVAAAPVKTEGIAPFFTTDLKERDDHFGLIFKGLLKIDRGGFYRLSMTSDDGAKLWFDGKPLLDLNRDGGGHADTWLQLGKGFHRIEVQFFENFAEESLQVGLQGPGITAENIPAELLFHE